MRKERIYFLLMKPFTPKFWQNFYKYGLLVLLALFVGFLLYLAIKYPREYPGYEYQTPPYYSPYPPVADSCIKNPEWCY